MTAIEESGAAGARSGKSTQDGDQLSVGDATWALTLPHLPYADAVHNAVLARGLVPGAVEAGVREEYSGRAELYLRLAWPPGHPALAEPVRRDGLTLAWAPLSAWSAHDRHGDEVLLDVPELAAPELIADAAAHYVRHCLSSPWVVPVQGRWEHAGRLDAALGVHEEREVEW
ncbi:hypothetical protein ABZX40_36505 [Streptomyces sp. NPDC004610]|uniref:hypothetical protein n=1 Tax=unclassified Streptomyces TaxID=2593676 RepID=UPI0033AB8523